jgi:PAS domain S-box-containing protein
MIPQWNWLALAALVLVVIYQQIRMFRLHRETEKREELFKIVTENAADMIALVDVKGHRLYNSPAYKRILGYSAAELGETSSFEQIHPDDRFKVLRRPGKLAAPEPAKRWTIESAIKMEPGGCWSRSRARSEMRKERSQSWSL